MPENTSIRVKDGIEIISASAFAECSNLIAITLPNSLDSIGEDAFSYCTSITYNIYDNAKYLGNKENPYKVKEHSR